MSIFVGNPELKDAYFNGQVKEIYLGSAKLYPSYINPGQKDSNIVMMLGSLCWYATSSWRLVKSIIYNSSYCDPGNLDYLGITENGLIAGYFSLISGYTTYSVTITDPEDTYVIGSAYLPSNSGSTQEKEPNIIAYDKNNQSYQVKINGYTTVPNLSRISFDFEAGTSSSNTSFNTIVVYKGRQPDKTIYANVHYERHSSFSGLGNWNMYSTFSKSSVLVGASTSISEYYLLAGGTTSESAPVTIRITGTDKVITSTNDILEGSTDSIIYYNGSSLTNYENKSGLGYMIGFYY